MRKGAGIIAINDGKILLVRAREGSGQVTGSIAFPGGKIDAGETELQTAVREFNEETGMRVLETIDFPGSYVEATLVLKEGVIDYSFKVFIATKTEGGLLASSETEPFWLDLAEARKTKLLGKGNELLENAIQFLKLEV